MRPVFPTSECDDAADEQESDNCDHHDERKDNSVFRETLSFLAVKD
jgi:hypothetical protein